MRRAWDERVVVDFSNTDYTQYPEYAIVRHSSADTGVNQRVEASPARYGTLTFGRGEGQGGLHVAARRVVVLFALRGGVIHEEADRGARR